MLLLGVGLHLPSTASANPGEVLETATDREGWQVETLSWPSTEKEYVTVHYPPDFDPRRVHCVLFWFHGTSGSPSPGVGRAHEGYITVGMSYLKDDEIPPGEYAQAHWQTCRAIRQSIASRRGLQLSRNVVGGVSKGGWMGFYLGVAGFADLHGILITAAGRDPNTREVPDLSALDLGVMVASGETDPNFPQAQLAIDFFRKAGAATLTYEEWLSEGHICQASPRVVRWLDVESRRGLPRITLEQHYGPDFAGEVEAAGALADPKLRYIALRHLLGDPRFPFVEAGLQDRVRALGRETANDPALAEWLEAFNRFRGLVTRECQFFDDRTFDVPKIELLVGHYREMAEDTRHPDLAARAANGYLRAAKMQAIYEAQVEAQQDPEFQTLTQRWADLQQRYAAADGQPAPEVLVELESIGARLGELRYAASMGAFREVEWRGRFDRDGSIEAVIQRDRDEPSPWRVFSGTGY